MVLCGFNGEAEVNKRGKSAIILNRAAVAVLLGAWPEPGAKNHRASGHGHARLDGQQMRNPKRARRSRSEPTKVRKGEVKRGHAVIPLVTVADVFYAGEKHGLMCRLDAHRAIDEPVVIVGANYSIGA